MKSYDKNLKKKGIDIKISEDAYRHYAKDAGGKDFVYLQENKMTLKSNFTVIFQNISLLIIVVMILMVNYSVSLHHPAGIRGAAASPFEAFIKKDLNAVPPTPLLIYDSENDINIIANIPEPEQPEEDETPRNISLINQNDEGLPNGCEAVAMTMLLKQFIPDLSPHEFVNRFLPTAPYLKIIDGILTGSDPEYYYIGDPKSAGYGIFAAGLAEGAQKCLDAYGITDKKVYNISGVSDDELFGYINDDRYVVVWITMNMWPVKWGSPTWHLPSGKLYEWPGNEHCVVLKGHDAVSVSLYDPTNNFIVYDKALFLSRWHEMGPYKDQGRQAVVIY